MAKVCYKILGKHLVTVCSWLFSGKNCMQARSCGVYKESTFIHIGIIYALLLLYVLSCISSVVLPKPT